MSINKTRRVLRKADRMLGDINAIQKGKMSERIVRRWAWSTFFKLFKYK